MENHPNPSAMVALSSTAQSLACSSVQDLVSSLSHTNDSAEHLMDLHLALAYCEAHEQKTKVKHLKAAIAGFFYRKGLETGAELRQELRRKTAIIQELIETNVEALAMVDRHQKLLRKLQVEGGLGAVTELKKVPRRFPRWPRTKGTPANPAPTGGSHA